MILSTSSAWKAAAAIACAGLLLNSAGSSGEWELVWSDEFDGKSLDYSQWSVEYNALGGGNNELQFYTDRHKNVRVANGKLLLEAHADDYSGKGTLRKYSSGHVKSKHRGDWKYGRIAVRAKLPIGKGLWPAIWMLPTEETYGGWAASGEIDVMEHLGHEPDRVHGSLHYGGAWPKNQHTTGTYELKTGSFADDFHVFAIEWGAGEIRWYVDGELYQTQKSWSSEGAEFPAPFDIPFHLNLNLAVGGRWPGNPDEATVFPQSMLIDWVRVHQRK